MRNNLAKSLSHKEQETRKARALDGEAEAFLVALTCGAPPEGQARWSLRLLKEALIEQQIVDSIGKETVRQTLKNRFRTIPQTRLCGTQSPNPCCRWQSTFSLRLLGICSYDLIYKHDCFTENG